MNRLDGDAAGPVKVLVSNPVYSHDRQHVLIPDGTIVLGEARKIGAAGFGQQRRMAVVFHRMIMPDGYSVDLDQFHGLDQIGEEGLKDKVNNHYLANLRNLHCPGRHRRRGRDRGRRRNHLDQRLPGICDRVPLPAFRSRRRRFLTDSCRFRRPSRSARATASRSTSRRTCCCLRMRTTPFPRRFEEKLMRRTTILFALRRFALACLHRMPEPRRPRSMNSRSNTTNLESNFRRIALQRC